MFPSRALKIGLIIVVTLAMAGVANALAAANTVPATSAGDGNGTISGYTITNVHYNLNASDPSTIDSVTFTVNSAIPAGGTVKIQLVSAGTWYTCTVSGGTNVTCTTTGASVSTATTLRVVAAQ